LAVLLDTSILVAEERGSDALEQVSDREGGSAISAITLAEFWKGLERARGATHRKRRQRFYDRVVAGFDVAPVDEEIALETARLWADLERRGSMIPAFDLLIAATALSRGWALATADVRDFGRVAGLELVTLPVE
jgi:predicted nucleic acid-binding protein